jgi:hypothetical protein
LVGNSLQNFLCVFRTLLFNLNHQLYLVGGRQRQANGISDFYNSCYAFDDNKKVWTTQKSLPYAISAGTGGGVVSINVYYLAVIKAKLFIR